MIFPEFHAVWTDNVLIGVTFPHTPPEIKTKVGFLAHTIEVMQDPEPLLCVQFLSLSIQAAETGGHIICHPVKDGPGFLDIFPVDGQGDVPLLHNAVGRAGDLVHKHGIVLGTVAVQRIISAGEQNVLLEILTIEMLVVDGDLGGGAGVQCVEKFGVSQEHGGFVLFGSDSIVDVRESDSF